MNATITRESRWLRGVISVSLFGFLTLFAFFPRLNPFPFCGFKVLTGLPCPLCGGTRAAHALLHGDISHAAYLNPLAIGVIGLLVAVGLVCVVEAIFGRTLANWPAFWSRWHRPLPVILIASLLLWWPFHIGTALRKPKVELVELAHPVAQAFRGFTQEAKK